MRYGICFVVVLFSSCLFSQEDDHRNWSFNKYSISIDDKWRLELTPIYRLNNNLTTFSSASIDIAIRRKLPYGLTAGVLARSWYFPGKKVRQFLWLDLVHKLPDFGLPISPKHRLRFHGGVNVPDWEEDGDFIRYYLGVVGKFKNYKVQPLIAIEPFYRLNQKNYVERFRYEYGFHIKANNNLKFIVYLINQRMYNFEETYTQYLWMTGFQYIFDKPLIKEKIIN